MIYVKDSFTYKIQKHYKKSDIWEGLFIEIRGDQLIKPITIGNIYRPPFDSNSNSSVENFIQQFNPVIDKISRNNSHAIIKYKKGRNMENFSIWYAHMVYFLKLPYLLGLLKNLAV